eukprot:m.177962 g.177962  ORF g.177962 m.177962 type:complete len:601 (+) comp14452_c0_seq1:77-1879(+)
MWRACRIGRQGVPHSVHRPPPASLCSTPPTPTACVDQANSDWTHANACTRDARDVLLSTRRASTTGCGGKVRQHGSCVTDGRMPHSRRLDATPSFKNPTQNATSHTSMWTQFPEAHTRLLPSSHPDWRATTLHAMVAAICNRPVGDAGPNTIPCCGHAAVMATVPGHLPHSSFHPINPTTLHHPTTSSSTWPVYSTAQTQRFGRVAAHMAHVRTLATTSVARAKTTKTVAARRKTSPTTQSTPPSHTPSSTLPRPVSRRGRGYGKSKTTTTTRQTRHRETDDDAGVAFAAAVVDKIGPMDGLTVLEHSPLRPRALSQALLTQAGALRVIRVGVGMQTDDVREAIQTDVASGVVDPSTFRVAEHANLGNVHAAADMAAALVGDSCARVPWHAPNLPDLAIVAVLPHASDRRFLVAWAFALGARTGLFQWGRVPAYFCVPSSMLDVSLLHPSSTLTGQQSGRDTPERQRVSLLLSAQADVTPLGTLPSLRGPPARPDDKDAADDDALELIRVTPLANPELRDVHWLNYCVRRLHVRRAKLGQAARALAPGSGQLLAEAGLKPSLDVASMSPEQHVALANALAVSPHRPDLELTESVPFVPMQ